MKNGNKLPSKEILREIPGLAFVDEKNIPKTNFGDLSKKVNNDRLSV